MSIRYRDPSGRFARPPSSTHVCPEGHRLTPIECPCHARCVTCQVTYEAFDWVALTAHERATRLARQR